MQTSCGLVAWLIGCTVRFAVFAVPHANGQVNPAAYLGCYAAGRIINKAEHHFGTIVRASSPLKTRWNSYHAGNLSFQHGAQKPVAEGLFALQAP